VQEGNGGVLRDADSEVMMQCGKQQAPVAVSRTTQRTLSLFVCLPAAICWWRRHHNCCRCHSALG
jgi:hypothetical protein